MGFFCCEGLLVEVCLSSSAFSRKIWRSALNSICFMRASLYSFVS